VCVCVCVTTFPSFEKDVLRGRIVLHSLTRALVLVAIPALGCGTDWIKEKVKPNGQTKAQRGI